MQEYQENEGKRTVVVHSEGDDGDIMDSWQIVSDTRLLQQVEDLLKDLQNPALLLSEKDEKRVCKQILGFLRDSQLAPIAFNCIKPFVKKILDPATVGMLADELYDYFVAKDHQKMAIEAIKIVISSLPVVDTMRMNGEKREFKMIVALIDSLLPRLIAGLSKTNVEKSVSLIQIMSDSFGIIIRSIEKHKNVLFWNDWLCTGIELGKGSYATVYLGRNVKTAELAAMKVMNWARLTKGRPKLKEQLENEISIMRAAKHPNIVGLYDVIRDDNTLVLVLEYCCEDLESYLKRKGGRLPEDLAQHWLQQLAQGLKFLRDKGLIHRDLKPGNLLLSTDNEHAILKITDFTFARLLEPGDLATTLVGTPLYMAPEIFLERKYTEKGDLWSVGVLLYQMLFGELPFKGSSVLELMGNLQRNAVKIPENIPVSANMKDLLRSLLHKNPDFRMSWPEFFLHPCVNSSLYASLSAAGAAPTTASAEQKLKEKEEELEKVLAELTQVKEELQKARADVDRSTEQLKTSEEVRQMSEARFAAALAALEASKNKHTEMGNALETMKHKQAEMSKAIDEKSSQMEKMKAELAVVKVSEETYANLLMKEQIAREEKEKELAEMKKTFEEMRKVYTQVRMNSSKMEEQTKLKQDHDTLRQELEKLKEMSKSQEETWSRQKQQLLEELAQEKSKNSVLASKSCDLEKERDMIALAQKQLEISADSSLKKDEEVILGQSQKIDELAKKLKEAEELLAVWAIAYPNVNG